MPARGSSPVTAMPATAALACAPGRVVAEVPWAQRLLAPERVWPHATGRGITVAVIDSEVDSTHRQLKGHVDAPLDYLPPPSPSSCVPHGTGVASIIAAQRVTGVGFRGLAPDARILPVRVSDRIDGSGATVDPATFARALHDAAARPGVKVINISLVLSVDDPSVRQAIEDVVAADIVVVAAVGNGHRDDGTRPIDPPSYPASYPGVLGVGAINQDGSRLPQSQVGSYVDIVAPGGDVLVATPGAGHSVESGTSYAAPFVSATAALLRQARPTATAREVISRILATAAPSRGGPGYGRGIVDPYRALTELLTGQDPVALPAAPALDVDPVAEAREARWRRLAGLSLVIFGVGLGLALAMVIGRTVYRRGNSRRWRATRAPRTPADAPRTP
jgi:membrane-anchored mycosin MYCP